MTDRVFEMRLLATSYTCCPAPATSMAAMPGQDATHIAITRGDHVWDNEPNLPPELSRVSRQSCQRPRTRKPACSSTALMVARTSSLGEPVVAR